MKKIPLLFVDINKLNRIIRHTFSISILNKIVTWPQGCSRIFLGRPGQPGPPLATTPSGVRPVNYTTTMWYAVTFPRFVATAKRPVRFFPTPIPIERNGNSADTRREFCQTPCHVRASRRSGSHRWPTRFDLCDGTTIENNQEEPSYQLSAEINACEITENRASMPPNGSRDDNNNAFNYCYCAVRAVHISERLQL